VIAAGSAIKIVSAKAAVRIARVSVRVRAVADAAADVNLTVIGMKPAPKRVMTQALVARANSSRMPHPRKMQNARNAANVRAMKSGATSSSRAAAATAALPAARRIVVHQEIVLTGLKVQTMQTAPSPVRMIVRVIAQGLVRAVVRRVENALERVHRVPAAQAAVVAASLHVQRADRGASRQVVNLLVAADRPDRAIANLVVAVAGNVTTTNRLRRDRPR
jgi:hypothetical protein